MPSQRIPHPDDTVILRRTKEKVQTQMFSLKHYLMKTYHTYIEMLVRYCVLLCNIDSPLQPLCHVMSFVIDLGREIL